MWNEFRGVGQGIGANDPEGFRSRSPYANELAEEAYQMVQATLAEEIYGKTFHVSRPIGGSRFP